MNPEGSFTFFVLRPMSDLFLWTWRLERRFEFNVEKVGYLRRVRDPDDRRRVWLEATPELYEKSWEIWGPLSDLWQSRARDLTREQLEFILEFLAEGNEMMSGQIERVQAMRDRR